MNKKTTDHQLTVSFTETEKEREETSREVWAY